MTSNLPQKTHDELNQSIEAMITQIEFLEEKQSLSFNKYTNDMTEKQSIERSFTGLRQHMVRLCKTAVEFETGSKTSHRKNSIRKAIELYIIQDDERYLEAFSFGEKLAKTYGPDAKDELVYNSLQNYLDRYRDFVNDFIDYIESYSS